MGRIKLTAKAYLLGNTLPLFVIFSVFALIVTVSGDFSFLISYLFRLPFLKDLVSTDFAYRMLKITLSVTGIVVSALTVPVLSLGIERWFLLKANGESVRVRDIFYFFGISRFLRSQSAFWYSFFIKAGVFLFFQFPAVCLFGVLYTAVKRSEIAYAIAVSLFIGSAVISLAGLIFYFVYSTAWLMYFYIIVSDETTSPYKAYKLSAEFAGKSPGKICLFRLSFIPWWLLCIFIFPLFYVWGYYKQSLAVLACENELSEQE